MSVATIAQDVRTRRRTARQIVDAALDAIRNENAALNAFTSMLAERARTRADSIDASAAAGEDPGPLAGVPFAAKNLFDVASVVTRAGATVTASDPPATRDADAIAALERAGAILIGLTNMDEFAYGFTTENAHDGATRNPHDRSRVAGGSSGGSAAAVAAGLVPLALGSDTNGSIRVPSAMCGIFGLRPTFGMLSRAGAYPFVNSSDVVGPFARTAGDLRAAYDALAGVPAFPNPLEGEHTRIARLGGYFEKGLVPEALRAVDVVCEALGDVPTVLFAQAELARKAAFIITAAEGGALHAHRLRDHASEYDPAVRGRLIAGALIPAEWYVRAQRFRTYTKRAFDELFAGHDVLLAPATPHPATLIGQQTITIDGITSDVRPNVGVFTQPITLGGVPVVTVPVRFPGHLPLGVQLIGRPGSDTMLLALASVLESRGVVGAGMLPTVAA